MRGGDNHREGRIMTNVTRRQRLRGTCKWGGVTLCVMLFALWLVSRWYFLGLFSDLRPATGIVARNGTLLIGQWPEFVIPHRKVYVEIGAKCGMSSTWHWREVGWSSTLAFSVYFPIWLPLTLIALPTGYLFWSDHRRRMRVGCCEQCGYDLTGNTTGRCPECGAGQFQGEVS